MVLPEIEKEKKEELPLKERPLTPEVPPEIEHVEAVAGAEISLSKPITDTGGGVILDNVVPQQVTVTLPLTEEEMQQALHLKIIYSLRWLAEWIKRVTKIVSGRFVYKMKF